MDWKVAGALGFGAVIGWYLYFINRYRKGDVSIGDLTTVIGAIGGGAVLALYDKGTDTFGAYGVGLALGFFGYFLSLVFLVGNSKGGFNSDWFLDGRRANPPADWGFGTDSQQTVHPMAMNPAGLHGPNPAGVQNFYLGSPGASLQLPTPMAALNPNAQKIIDACRAVWPGQHDACNYFAIDVGQRLGVTLSGKADQIVDQIKGPGWTPIANGPAARDAATQGKFVLAALKSGDFTQPRSEGHVAVVVAGAMNPLKWAPAGYWGSTDGNVADQGGSGAPISLCFRLEDKDKIVYASRDI